MIRKSAVFFLFIVVVLILLSGFQGAVSARMASSSDMPYRGLLIGTYWQQWPWYNHLQEYTEPNFLFIGLERIIGPEEHQFYRFIVHLFHDPTTSLIMESFRGTQQPHFLCGFSRFLEDNVQTRLVEFTGTMRGQVIRYLSDPNVYALVALKINGTGYYVNHLGEFFHKNLSGFLPDKHCIELIYFNGTKTPFFVSGTGDFKYWDL